ncbi:TIGR03086 family metal-binding protein [Kribbella sp. NBC_01505]|uniref:TIGR03086 family metal-binding protein n=1 Tax=Kribbella sp. NBC_01505 TaxID=2903580 RepID=UPI0038693C6C
MDVELLVAASAEFERVVQELPDESWHLPTPCEVDVHELVEHVVGGNRFAVAALSGVSAAEAWEITRAQGFGPELKVVQESAAAQLAAFEAAAEDQVVHHPNGDIPAEAFLRYRLVDLVVHAWDLLWTARLDETVDARLTEAVWRVIEPKLPEMLAFGSYGDGPSGKVPSDAPAQLKLLDAFGRRPV